MHILAVSDLHGDLASVHKAIDRFAPDALLCCGDWGDPQEVTEADLAAFPAKLPTLSTFGNHDAVEQLKALRNSDGSTVLLGQGEVRGIDGLRIAAIGGIWAKSHRLPYYVTDEDVAAYAAKIAADGAVDILLTHGCPVGLADLTEKGNHGGQRCFLKAFQTIGPRVHLCGHLHVAQEHVLKDGRRVLNVGATPSGSVVLIDASAGSLTARLERIP
ncbi:MAG: metallophosphoesterase family protein [Isosphaeraceae bacterium]|nr:metallophosphoesterase family protein [Isosphaeraceae bacterium]